MLVGLKTDLRHDHAVIELLKTHGMMPVSKEQGKEVAKRMHAKYVECSSKEMVGVHEVFDLAMDIAIGVPGAAAGGGGGGADGSISGKKRKKKQCTIL